MEGSHNVFEELKEVVRRGMGKLTVNGDSRTHVETEKRLATGCTERQGKKKQLTIPLKQQANLRLSKPLLSFLKHALCEYQLCMSLHFHYTHSRRTLEKSKTAWMEGDITCKLQHESQEKFATWCHGIAYK